ncbi:MAG: hypothetical protein ACYTFW_10895 [Planctomycetota bacterium]
MMKPSGMNATGPLGALTFAAKLSPFFYAFYRWIMVVVTLRMKVLVRGDTFSNKWFIKYAK